MAIKLADVLNNVNAAYPVVNAHEHTVVGFYNGATSNSSTSVEVYYNSGVKSSISTDGGAVNQVSLTSLPYANASATGEITADSTNKILTEVGGIITLHDSTLGGAGASAAYMVQTLSAGNVSDTTRFSTDKLTELIQDFDMYSSINGEQLTALNDLASHEFYMAGYDTQSKKTRKISWAEMMGAISGTVIQDMVSGGLITNNQADGGSGTGVVGDINGDGEVTTADLLMFLGNFGTGTSNSFATNRTLMSGTSETSNVVSVSELASSGSGTGGTFLLSDLSTFNYPSTYTLTGNVYGWGTEVYSTNAANVYKLQGFTVGADYADIFQNRYLYVTLQSTVHFYAPDALFGLMHIKLIDQSASANEEEVVFYMAGNSFSATDGVYSYNGTTGGAPIGTDYSVTWTGSSNPNLISAGLVAADNYQNHSTALASGFNFAFQGGSFTDYIDDIEIKFFFYSLNGFVDITVNSVQVQIVA